MSRYVGFALVLTVLLTGVDRVIAATIAIDISPAVGFSGGTPLSNTNYTALRDHRFGLRSRNETVPPGGPTGRGNEVGSGIVVDTDTGILSYDFAYGAIFGSPDLFRNLSSPFRAVHIHNGTSNFPAANTSGAVIYDLGADHTPSGPLAGRVTGSVLLSLPDGMMADLFDNELYINIHSENFTAGEIRGQLVPVPEPSSMLLTVLLGVCGLFGMSAFACNHHQRLAI